MSSPTPPPDVFAENPYTTHAGLSPIEAEVLWEYAKLAQNLKQVRSCAFDAISLDRSAMQLKQKTRNLTEKPDTALLARLRVLENKMGLILTLFKASVWGVINEQNVAEPSRNSLDFTSDTRR
ncbi:DASH complex subunit Dad3-domain-containing protein [Mycena vulgaris]|nr:DASH complex subunit Dad3-domain-containing protein [Mycena vulgaris]